MATAAAYTSNRETQYTINHLLTKEQRTALESFWGGDFHKKASLTHHLLYAMLRGKDWRKTATPPTNAVKVRNGALRGWCFWGAYRHTHFMCRWSAPTEFPSRHRAVTSFLEPWEGIVTEAMLYDLRQRLPDRPAAPDWDLTLRGLDGTTWTCPAYAYTADAFLKLISAGE